MMADNVSPGHYLKNPEAGEEAGRVPSGHSTSLGPSRRSWRPVLSTCATASQPAAGRARAVSHNEHRTLEAFPQFPH